MMDFSKLEKQMKENACREQFRQICLIGHINRLALGLMNGVIPFSKAKQEHYRKHIFIYDDLNPIAEENLDGGNGEYTNVYPRYRIVLDSLIDEEHHDIISYYDSIFEGMDCCLIEIPHEDGTTEYVIEISREDENDSIVIDDTGNWCSY